jgi:hypothetical protein
MEAALVSSNDSLGHYYIRLDRAAIINWRLARDGFALRPVVGEIH